MNTPFSEKPLVEYKAKFKLFGSTPNPNAIIELNNLLASKMITDVSIKDVQTIVFKYRVNLKRHFLSEIKQFYKEYFEHCLDDKFLSDDEVHELVHLKRILTLNDKDVNEIHNEVAGNIYQKAVDEALDDQLLEADEKVFLTNLQKDLRLNPSIANKIYQETASSILNKLIDDALDDVLLTPEEELEISELAGNLNIDYKDNKHTFQELEKFKLFWQIENGDMPIINTEIALLAQEKCHFKTSIDWMEEYNPIEKPYYRGAEINQKIASGIYWKAGKLGAYELPKNVWRTLDKGLLLVTNKRLIFIGLNEKIEISLESITDFEAYNNGIEIKINNQTLHPFLRFSKNIDLFSIIFGNAIIYNEKGFSNDGKDE